MLHLLLLFFLACSQLFIIAESAREKLSTIFYLQESASLTSADAGEHQ